MATRIIGIDFGTSTTVVRVHNVGAGNRIVPLTVNGCRTIPTIAFQKKDSDEIYYGYDAKAEIDSMHEGVVYENFKMNLISDDDAKREQAVILTQGFLKYVYSKYQILLNDGVFDAADEVKVYVSHPAKWNSYARTIMKQSVVSAGFCKEENIALKDEPTAAILAVIHERKADLIQGGLLFEGRKYKTMMIDMGAGTTDIVLCSYIVRNKKLEIDDIFTYPSINTPGLCGGREIDKAIISEAELFVNQMQKTPSASGQKVIKKLERRVKIWKETSVSGNLGKSDVLTEPDEIASFRDTLSEFGIPIMNEGKRFSISREYFENFTKNHWIQWVGLLQGTFAEVKGEQYNGLDCPKKPEDVELLIVTGGHSQWYIVSDYLLGKKPLIDLPAINFAKVHGSQNRMLHSEDPQETVAVGLCHLGEDVVGTIAASNDVSISFSCEGKYLGACDLIKKGVPLPFEKRDYLIKNSINGNFIFRKELRVEYSIVTDKTNTITKSQVVPSTNIFESILRAALALLGVAIFDIPRILWYLIKGELDKLDDTVVEGLINNEYAVELSPDIIVNEEGIIKVGGTISVDGESLVIPEIII